jgi:palmitoyltransferase ZDHHC9/14/18
MPHAPNTNTFPNPDVTQSEAGDVASILSSRMTDIASDDGGEHPTDPTNRSTAQSPGQRRSIQTTSRPNTAVTGVSSQRSAWPQAAPPSRRGYVSSNATQRGSTLGSVSGSTAARPHSATSRTHVPSLTSHAFFRPMSSQRLQAQRGGTRPATIVQQGMSEDGSAEGIQQQDKEKTLMDHALFHEGLR